MDPDSREHWRQRSSFVPGQYLTYTVTAFNAGDGSTTGVVVSDPIPSGLLLINNGVNTMTLTGGGSGYTSAPTVVFSSGAATAVAGLNSAEPAPETRNSPFLDRVTMQARGG